MTTDHAAEVARIEAERAKFPKDERQRLEAADAPLLRIQLLYMLERAKKAEAAVERVQVRLAAWEQQLPEVVKLAPIIQTVRRDLGIEEAPGRPAEDPRCAECGHPKADHQDADEPVSVGLCTACDEADSDDAEHDYEPEEQQ